MPRKTWLVLAMAVVVTVATAVVLLVQRESPKPPLRRLSGELYTWSIINLATLHDPTPSQHANVSEEDLAEFPLLKEAIDHRPQAGGPAWHRDVQRSEMEEANRTMAALRARIHDANDVQQSGIAIRYRDAFYALSLDLSSE